MTKIVTMLVMILSVLAISCEANTGSSGSGSGGGKKIDLSEVLKPHAGLNFPLSTSGFPTGLTGTVTSITWDSATKTSTSQANAITAITSYNKDATVEYISNWMEDLLPNDFNIEQFADSPTVTEKVEPAIGGADGEWNIRLTAADGYEFDNGTKFYDYKLVLITQ